MSTIPDLTESQIWTVTSTLKERFKEEVEVQEIDSDIRLSPHDRELTTCPGLYWQVDGCTFVIFKTGKSRYRAQADHDLKQQEEADKA